MEKRSPWRLSIITETFWGILDMIYTFFRLIVDPKYKPDPRRGDTDYYRKDGGGGGPPPNVKGFRKTGGANVSQYDMLHSIY